MSPTLAARIEALTPQLTAWRRDFHRHPEPGWCEFRTAATVAAILDGLGWTVAAGAEVVDAPARMGLPDDATLSAAFERARQSGVSPKWLDRLAGGLTGVVATLDSGRPGPTLAIRVDLDALPIAESQAASHCPAAEGFASCHAGWMHACGHDGHTAIGLGVATLLAERRDQLVGRVKLIFQPAEEGVRGAAALAEAGVVDDVDRFVAVHLGLGCPGGTVLCGCDGFLATSKLDIRFDGRSAHAGGQPEIGRNALLAAAFAVTGLHSIAPHSAGASRLNVGRLRAGTARNAIADRAELEIETRGATTAIDDYMRERAAQIIHGAALAQGVTADVVCVGRAVECASSPDWVARIASTIAGLPGIEQVLAHDRSPRGSEDATTLMARVQARGGWATYMIVGSDLPAGHHQPAFDIDESCLPVAVRALAEVALAPGP
ncbi:amidohydrolase [Salinisphaera sp. LB1]|uniref:amidohydrolase n=1 Tax=Salinisphaera sp. LB1 TaxID=2183911 RepID=UPI000D70691C|nr:amidohydrolase [Salinisphaera sp. LB1]AWN15049.1 Catalyzes the cleavage of p-aminobenzoyl-glutamate to p-aminobenzoate and glutamate, subunit A [Salinisphaera sp. LB1]